MVDGMAGSSQESMDREASDWRAEISSGSRGQRPPTRRSEVSEASAVHRCAGRPPGDIQASSISSASRRGSRTGASPAGSTRLPHHLSSVRLLHCHAAAASGASSAAWCKAAVSKQGRLPGRVQASSGAAQRAGAPAPSSSPTAACVSSMVRQLSCVSWRAAAKQPSRDNSLTCGGHGSRRGRAAALLSGRPPSASPRPCCAAAEPPRGSARRGAPG